MNREMYLSQLSEMQAHFAKGKVLITFKNKRQFVEDRFVTGSIIPMSGVRETIPSFPLSRIVPLLTCSVLKCGTEKYKNF